MQRSKLWGFIAAVLVVAVAGYFLAHKTKHEKQAEWKWSLPPGFLQPKVPADNPMSEAKFQLGRHLFFDTRLSGNGTMGCGSCHLQKLAFTDGKPVAVGSTGDHTARGSMSIVNSAYYPTLTWANPSQVTLEIQAAVPISL